MSSIENSSSLNIGGKIKDYLKLIKPSLSIMVVFSSVLAYLLVPGIEDKYEDPLRMTILLAIGGLLVTGSANTINQAVEKDTDAMMKRTANRPVASGRMSVTEAWIFAIVTGAVGIFILGNYFNWTSAGLAALSLFLYAFIYTPLKKVNAVAVLVGAFPGALPCLIGWAAGDETLSIGGWVLFGIQFLWQFPHFWAICWIAYKDYSVAGFKLLPSEQGPTKFTALQTVIYSLLLLPMGVVPYFIGMSGKTGLIIVTVANLFMVWQCIRLYREMEVKAARRVMFSSYIYLPVVLFALLGDKMPPAPEGEFGGIIGLVKIFFV
jgi:protoheme IX farnesyltransferase